MTRSSSLLDNGTFFFPGPTEVRREVLEAMARPMIPHRGKEFESMFGRIQAALGLIFGTSRTVFVSTSSATGLMEAGIRCAPAGRVLSVVNGAFSARFAAIAKGCGRETDVIEVPWGEPADPDRIAGQLEATRYAAMTIVHSETSTGALSDVRTATRLAREHGVTCLVDSVTGVGGAELRFDEWELDYALTGSQKALALPPGLAFAAASESFMTAARRAADRGLYFDLVEFDAYGSRHQTPNTPAIPLLYAADVQLAAIAAEGMPARWARHAAMAERTHAWVDELRRRTGKDVRVLAREGSRSPTVTGIGLPAGMTGPEVANAVAEQGFVIGTGYGRNRETSIRIGHMGDHTITGLEACLAVVAGVVEGA